MENGTQLEGRQLFAIPSHCIGTVYNDGGYCYQIQPINFRVSPYDPGFDAAVAAEIAAMAADLGIPESGYVSASGRWYENAWAFCGEEDES